MVEGCSGFVGPERIEVGAFPTEIQDDPAPAPPQEVNVVKRIFAEHLVALQERNPFVVDIYDQIGFSRTVAEDHPSTELRVTHIGLHQRGYK